MKIDGMDATVRTPASNQVEQVKLAQTEKKPVAKENEKANEDYKLSEAFIRRAVDKANDAMVAHYSSLEFKVHERTNEIIVRIVDNNTKEVIREIPSEKILDMVASMLEQAGLLVDERR